MTIVCVVLVVVGIGAGVVSSVFRAVLRDVSGWAVRVRRRWQIVRVSQAARQRAARVEAEQAAAEKVRVHQRTRALAEVFGAEEDLAALGVSLDREMAAVRARYAEKVAVVEARRDAALLVLADLGRTAAAIAESTGLSVREVNRRLTVARRARGQDGGQTAQDAGRGPVDAIGVRQRTGAGEADGPAGGHGPSHSPVARDPGGTGAGENITRAGRPLTAPGGPAGMTAEAACAIVPVEGDGSVPAATAGNRQPGARAPRVDAVRGTDPAARTGAPGPPSAGAGPGDTPQGGTLALF